MVESISREKVRRRFLDWFRNNNFDKQYDREKLYEFYLSYFMLLPKYEREAITSFIVKGNVDILSYDFSVNLDNIKSSYIKEKAIRAKRGNLNYCKKTTKEQRSVVNASRVQSIQKTRIEKIKKENPNLTSKEALSLSYVNGIRNKGIKIANFLGLDLRGLSEDEILSLSGYTKRENFKLLSDEQREQSKIQWKRTNLKNTNVRETIVKEYPGFLEIDIDLISSGEVDKWYSIYNSIRTIIAISLSPENRGNYKGCKKGFYSSKKNNRQFWYRSSLELKTLGFLERNNSIDSYLSEPYHIKYQRDTEGFERAYMPDVVIFYNGKRVLLEVKPEFKVEEFKKIKLNYLNLKEQLIIITEKQLINKQIFDEYLKTNITR